MDKHLENLVNELSVAINDAIQRSDEVNEVLERIRATGHEILLAVEATIALQENQTEDSAPFRNISIEDRLKEISSEDRKFLRSLNIKFDNDE